MQRRSPKAKRSKQIQPPPLYLPHPPLQGPGLYWEERLAPMAMEATEPIPISQEMAKELLVARATRADQAEVRTEPIIAAALKTLASVNSVFRNKALRTISTKMPRLPWISLPM